MSNFEQVRAWHKAFGVDVGLEPRLLSSDRRELRFSLISEEYKEYRIASAADDLIGIADALTDLLYVIYGAMVEHGFNADRLFVEVQRSNMSKLGADGKPILREDGKILKGPGFFPPDIAGILGV